MKYFIWLPVFLMMFLIGCDKEPAPSPAIQILPGTATLSVGQAREFSINFQHFPTPIFGVSMRIQYESQVLSFTDSTGFMAGDFFGSDVITLAVGDSGTIYLACTLTQGQPGQSGSGELGTLSFTSLATGTSVVAIHPTELVFYDAAGDIVLIPDLEMATSEIIVQ